MTLIDIKAYLKDARKDSVKKLVAQGYSTRDIQVCVSGVPYGKYCRFIEEEHPLLFDDAYRFHIEAVRYADNLENWLANDEHDGEQWLSHGFILGYLQFHAWGPERYAAMYAQLQSEIARRPRAHNKMSREVIDYFLNLQRIPTDQNIVDFEQFIGESRTIHDIEVDVTAVQNAGGITDYVFEDRNKDKPRPREELKRGTVAKNIKRAKKNILI